jgi:DNA-binding transcriptional LysR family regulator
MECDSFPAAGHAVRSGSYAAVLPALARCDLPGDSFEEIQIPFLRGQTRLIHLAWNPRLAKLRDSFQKTLDWLAQHLQFATIQ